jgi:dephospho-CoA kinase
MISVGLTGSIAVGKSHVADVFRQLGCHVLDADQTARDVLGPGSPGLSAIVEAFGPGVLASDGSLDRKKLGSIVFADPAKRKLLNSIVHPLVIEEQNKWLEDIHSRDPMAIAIIDAALMIESGGYRRFDKLIVVWCRDDLQLQRLKTRDRLDEADAERRIAAQMPQDEKKRFADFLIDTSDGYESAERQVLEIYRHLRFLADTN